MTPRTNPHEEYESPIHEYRIAAGLTRKELTAIADISVATLSDLANGTLSPIKKNGQLIKAAKARSCRG